MIGNSVVLFLVQKHLYTMIVVVFIYLFRMEVDFSEVSPTTTIIKSPLSSSGFKVSVFSSTFSSSFGVLGIVFLLLLQS